MTELEELEIGSETLVAAYYATSSCISTTAARMRVCML